MSKVITFKDVFAHCVDEDHIDKWDKIALSTEKVDKVKSEELINKIYVDADLDAPNIVWCESPRAAALKIASILETQKYKHYDDVGRPSEYYSIFHPVRHNIFNSHLDYSLLRIERAVSKDFFERVPPMLRWHYSLAGIVSGQIDDYLADHGDVTNDYIGLSWYAAHFYNFPASIYEGCDIHKYRVSTHTAIFDIFKYSQLFDKHSFKELIFFDFCRSRVGLEKETEVFFDFMELSKVCGRIYTFKGLCIATERPSTLCINRLGLHNETGPSVTYNDGWNIYAIDGHCWPEYKDIKSC